MADTSDIPEGPVIGCVHIRAMLDKFAETGVSFSTCGCCGGVSFHCNPCNRFVDEPEARVYLGREEGEEE